VTARITNEAEKAWRLYFFLTADCCNKYVTLQQVRYRKIVVTGGLLIWFTVSKTVFCTSYMNKKRKPYTFLKKATSIFLMLTLLWLTVSTPFIITMQQEQDRQEKSASFELPVNDGEDSNDSSGNNVEEKAPNTSLSEEFLHDHHADHYWFLVATPSHQSQNAGIYIAFHGELHAPPPNAG
jgi:hypothetical protein